MSVEHLPAAETWLVLPCCCTAPVTPIVFTCIPYYFLFKLYFFNNNKISKY